MYKSKEEFLREFTKKYVHLIPEYLRDNDSFLVFFALLCREFDISYENIRSFTDIINPDKAPKEFLDCLGAYFNYHYLDRAPEYFNRELIMRNRKLYEDRGTEKSIIMAATHGDNEGYVGGDIFIPGYEISQDMAELIIARDKVFIHSKSKFSSSHVYSDSEVYRPGVLILMVPYLDHSVRNKLWEVIPAGIRLRFIIVSDLKPNKQDPIDVYNFIPETGAPKSKYRTLTWYPYFRVTPIFTHGDVNPTGLSYYDDYRNNYPIGLDYTIEMEIKRKFWDILIHSDGTVNRGDIFDSNGLIVGDYNNTTLVHGRRLHSGVKLVDEHIVLEPSMAVSALPLSFVRKPFPLSSLPENATFTESSEMVVIREGGIVTHEIITEIKEKESFKFSSVPEEDKYNGGSRHSGGSTVTIHNDDGTESEITTTGNNQVYGGTFKEIKKEYEQEYIEEETINIPVKNYNYYRITPTGEYEDRIDKLTVDAVTRNFDILLDVEKPYSYKHHTVFARSTHNGIRSGTVYNDNYANVLNILLYSGLNDEEYHVNSWISNFNGHASQSIIEDSVYEMMNIIHSDDPDKDTIQSLQEKILNYENVIIPQLEEIYNKSKEGSLEKEQALENLNAGKAQLQELVSQLNNLIEEIEGTYILDYDSSGKVIGSHREGGLISTVDSILTESGSDEDLLLKKQFHSILKWYYSKNPTLSGIYDKGSMMEYSPIMTIQPSDAIYPISEVLDYKADYNKPWDLEKLKDDTEGQESSYGLYSYGENRNPFFTELHNEFEREIRGENGELLKYDVNVFDFDIV